MCYKAEVFMVVPLTDQCESSIGYIQSVSKWLERFGSWLYSHVWWRDL